jgi:hypothetical protein
VVGVVYDYTDTFARGVPVTVRGQAGSKTLIDGRVQLPNVTTGGILVVGDSKTTPTLLFPFSADSTGTFLERPLHLPALESGISASLPSSISAVTTVSGDALPGVSLTFGAGSNISGSSGVDVRVLGVSPSRLPVPVRGGSGSRSEPRAAYLIEPHQATFSPAATLRVPVLEATSSGPFDAYRVDTGSGLWVKHADNVAPVTSGSIVSFELSVTEATLYAVVPRTAPTTVTVTGRVVAGGLPVVGYRASCWNRVSKPTGEDGTFTIDDVPNVYGVFLVRAFPEKPGSTHKPEFVLATSVSQAFGDVVVTARPPDLIRPTVRSTSPVAGSSDQSRSAQIVVTFSEAIDPTLVQAFKVTGPKGDVAGTFSFDNAFTVRLRPQERLDPSADYTILVEASVQDLSGNLLEDTPPNFKFTTQAGTPDPPPTDTLAFGLQPLTGAAGDVIKIAGRGYTGGTTAKFGGFQALVRSETVDQIEVDVPGTTPAGDVTIALDAGGTAIKSLQPLVLDLRASVAVIYSGTTPQTPLVALDRTSPPAQIVIDGKNVGGASVTIDGVSIAAVDSTVLVGADTVATGRTISLGIPAPATIVSGPVVVRGANGEPSRTYRFLQVKE